MLLLCDHFPPSKDRVLDTLGRVVKDFSNFKVAALAFEKSVKTDRIRPRDHGVAFPMTEFKSLIDGLRPLANEGAARDPEVAGFLVIES